MALVAFIGFVLGAVAVLIGFSFGLKWQSPDAEGPEEAEEDSPKSWREDLLRKQLFQEAADQERDSALRFSDARKKVHVASGGRFL